MSRIGVGFIIFMCWTQIAISQVSPIDNLNGKILENEALFKTDPLKAYKEIDKLLEQAIQLEDATAELRILSKRYKYDYFLKIDFEEMFSSAKILQDRAKHYKSLLYEAKSHKYLAQTYSFNELYDKALDELGLAMEILDKASPEDPDIIMEKANVYTAFANVYNLKDEYYSGIQSLLNSVKEHDKLSDSELKRGTKFMDYSNLGGAYLKVNLDSAVFYANKSISLSSYKEANHDLTFLNFIVIGDVYLSKGEYDQAVEFYNKAEAIKENKHFLNIKQLYTNLIDVYEKQGNIELKNVYENKLKDLSLTVTQNQNKSLRRIIQDKNLASSKQPKNYKWLWVSGIFVFIVIVVIIVYKLKRKRIVETNLTPEVFNNLVRLLKENDQTFILAFENQFPNFTQNLLKSSPDLSTSEIELLAMVKLGLSNKEIAQFKFIQHKTVQNKRHIIRKKLGLSSTTDLDKWVEDL